MQVFLSYSRKDQEFVHRLAADLEARGLDVWLDTEDLAKADEDRWRRSIVQGIRDSAVLVLVLSPDSVTSDPVERELTLAAEINRRVVPIVYRPCELPDGFQFELAGVQRIDFSELPYDEALDQLVRRIGPGDRGDDHDATTATAVSTATTATMPVLPPPPMVPVATAAATAPAPVTPSAPATPIAPSKGTSKGTKVAIAVAAIVLLLGAIGIISALSSGGSEDGDDGSAEVRQPEDTTPTETTVEPSDTTEPSPDTTAPTAVTEEDADRLVEEIQSAYNNRDWDAVRRLDPGSASQSDSDFEALVGTADGVPRLVEGFPQILRSEQTGESTWTFGGAIIAHDLLEGELQSTNVLCVNWDVDVAAGTSPFSGVEGTDGQQSRRLDRSVGWVAESDFETTAAQFCG